MKPTIQLLTTAILLLMATTSIDAQTTRYVDPTGTDSGGCNNPASPCATINYAIGQAGTGDIIDIATGVYTEIISTNKSITLQGAGQTQPGGTIIQAHPSPGVSDDIVITTLENDFMISDLVVRNGRIGIISYSENFTLTDVTISDNNSSGGSNSGVIIYQSSATLSGVTFENNSTALGPVGALNVATVASNTVSLTDVLFTGNQANQYAGAMLIIGPGAVTLEDVTFYQNTAGENGGALYLYFTENVSLNNVVFDSNEAAGTGRGGAIFSTNSTATFTDVQFIENQSYIGGAVCGEENSNLNFANTLFLNNQSLFGGGFTQIESTTTMVNTLFFENTASAGGGGGGISNVSNSELTLINTTITDNKEAGVGGGIYTQVNSLTTLLNTLVWGNTTTTNSGNDIFTDPGSTTTGAYNLYNDGADAILGDFTCSNCVTGNPGFTNPGSGDFTLSAGSPAIDAGDPGTDLSVFPGGPSNPVDLNGNARVQDGTIDIGAYEFGTLSTGDFLSMENITLYPNPVKDILNLTSEKPIQHIELYNIAGQSLPFILNSSQDITASLDLSGMASGVYFVKVTAGGQKGTYKVVKQ